MNPRLAMLLGALLCAAIGLAAGAPACAQGSNPAPHYRSAREQLQNLDRTLDQLKETREAVTAQLKLATDKDILFLPVGVTTEDDKLLGIPDYLANPKAVGFSASSAWVPVKRSQAASALTMTLIFAALQEAGKPKDAKARTAVIKGVLQKVARAMRQLKADSDRARGVLESQLRDVDRWIASNQTQRDRVAIAAGLEERGAQVARAPEPVPAVRKDFGGDWETEWGKMHLVQSGSHVSGTYTVSEGTIDGVVTGSTLRFKWYQKGNGHKGTGRFTLSGDGSSFTGDWNYTDDPDKGGSRWTGRRLRPVDGGRK